MTALSSTDLSIALAIQAGALRFVERVSRLGGTFVAVEDASGVIEVHADQSEATRRVRAIELRAGL